MAQRTYWDFAEEDRNFLKDTYEEGYKRSAMAAMGQNICERYLKHIISEYVGTETQEEENQKEKALRTHNLRILEDYIRNDMGIAIPDDVDELLTKVNGYYFTTRYPGDESFLATEKDADNAYAAVEATREFVKEACLEIENRPKEIPPISMDTNEENSPTNGLAVSVETASGLSKVDLANYVQEHGHVVGKHVSIKEITLRIPRLDIAIPHSDIDFVSNALGEKYPMSRANGVDIECESTPDGIVSYANTVTDIAKISGSHRLEQAVREDYETVQMVADICKARDYYANQSHNDEMSQSPDQQRVKEAAEIGLTENLDIADTSATSENFGGAQDGDFEI